MSSTAQIGYDTVLTMTASNKQPTQVYVPYVKATCMWRRAPLLLHIRLARGGPGLPWPATHDGLTWSTCPTQHIVVHGSCAELTPTTRFDHGLVPWLPRPCEWQTALTTQMALLSVQELCLVPGLSMMGSSCGLPAAAQCACPLAHLARILDEPMCAWIGARQDWAEHLDGSWGSCTCGVNTWPWFWHPGPKTST